ncbi:hypothetical protein AB205_0217500 [Aquarana catesbeiana]|uniref:Poly(A) polymerase RNA-binding domain-containing protein n=1 Tax=Aquarana catesbeiana TaxID=8400 RepID=A0A2G9SG44_AQUCT|nr:hypothetical protein AB205_0217500 [Aquarana catesbeiana]
MFGKDTMVTLLWPKCMSSSNEHLSMWFLGIIFKKVENTDSVNIDLTQDIQLFTDTVYRQAHNINLLKKDVKIEATHVRRKQLHKYLPPEALQKRKKDTPTVTFTPSLATIKLHTSYISKIKPVAAFCSTLLNKTSYPPPQHSGKWS